MAHFRNAAILFTATMALVGCGDRLLPEAQTEGGTLVDKAGGVVAGPDGVTLEIPEGAIDKPVRFSIRRAQVDTGSFRRAGSGYEFQPHGTQFKKNVTATVPYDDDLADGVAESLTLLWSERSDGQWKALETEVIAPKKQVKGFTKSLSFGVAAFLPEDDSDDSPDTDTETIPDTHTPDSDTVTDTDVLPDTETTISKDTDTGQVIDTQTEDTDTGEDTMAFNDQGCDLSLTSVVQIDAENNTVCLTLPRGLVMQPGESLIISQAYPYDMSSFYDFFPYNWPPFAMEPYSEQEPEDTSAPYLYRDHAPEDGARTTWFLTSMYDEAYSFEFPLLLPGHSFALYSGPCEGGAYWSGSGTGATASGTMIDGWTPAYDGDGYWNLTRALIPGDAETGTNWIITGQTGYDRDNMTAGGAAVRHHRNGARITEIHLPNLDTDPETAGPHQFIEITCPGGDALKYCDHWLALGCDQGDNISPEQCLVDVRYSVPADLATCALNATVCTGEPIDDTDSPPDTATDTSIEECHRLYSQINPT